MRKYLQLRQPAEDHVLGLALELVADDVLVSLEGGRAL
jgi:hypothetical protein